MRCPVGEMEPLRALLAESSDAESRARVLASLLEPGAAEALAGLAADAPSLRVRAQRRQAGFLRVLDPGLRWIHSSNETLCRTAVGPAMALVGGSVEGCAR